MEQNAVIEGCLIEESISTGVFDSSRMVHGLLDYTTHPFTAQ